MRNIKITLEYDGSSFYGFQKQPKHLTIQEAFEKSLSKLLNKKTKIQAASGRTDTGVHAEGQVVNFHTDSKIAVKKIQKGLNALLPKEIAVIDAKVVADKFHSRYSAKSKVYEYKIWNSEVRSPLLSKTIWHFPTPINISKVKQGIKLFKGRHDFKAFSGSGGSQKTSVRTLKRFTVKKEGEMLIIRVEADGFLYHMVRNLVGTLMDLGTGKMTLPELRIALKSKDRRNAGRTAPAQGLRLVSVKY